MKIYAAMDRGLGKEVCEDEVLLGHTILSEGEMSWNPRDDKFFLAIADGVGGNHGGANASFFVLEKIRNDAKDSFNAILLEEFLKGCNKDLIRYASKVPECENMATTLTGLLFDNKNTFLFHVGNTRACALNGSFLRQLTEDHTNVSSMVSMGLLTKEEALKRPDANVINSCFGNADENYASKLTVKDISEEIGTKKPLILTSDGIHDYLSEDEMEEILSVELSVPQKLRILIEKSRDKGSVDDISVIWVERDS